MKTTYPWEALTPPETTEDGIKYDSFTAGEYSDQLRNQVSTLAVYHAKKLKRKFKVSTYQMDGKKYLTVKRTL